MILLLIMLLLDAVESMGVAAKGYGISSSDISRQRFEPRQVITTSTSTPIPTPTVGPNKKAGLAWSGGGGGDIVQFRVAQASVVDTASGTGTGTSTASSASSAAATGTGGSSNSTTRPETGLGVSWYYTWSAYPASPPSRRETLNLEFVPMLWGSRTASEFEKTISDTIENASERLGVPVRAILGMNEPERTDQAGIKPADAVQMWQKSLEPLRAKYGVRLGSPAISSAPNGKAWLQEFWGICGLNSTTSTPSCQVDFVAAHWYGSNATYFKSYVQDMHATFGKPVWITEWACHDFVKNNPCSKEETLRFLNETKGYLDSNVDGAEFVERYAWFGAMREGNMEGILKANALMDNEGRLNELGVRYVGSNISSTSGSESSSRFNGVPSMRALAVLFVSSLIGLGILL